VVCLKCVIVKPRKMRRPRPPRGCRAIEKKISVLDLGIEYLESSLSTIMLSFVKYVGCLRDTVYEDPVHIFLVKSLESNQNRRKIEKLLCAAVGTESH
jgi:uncharacterized protein YeeX (DUF496 family)